MDKNSFTEGVEHSKCLPFLSSTFPTRGERCWKDVFIVLGWGWGYQCHLQETGVKTV